MRDLAARARRILRRIGIYGESSINVENLTFQHLSRTLSDETSLGYSSNYVIKIEHRRNPRKINDLLEEGEIISLLNSYGCVSCPKLISKGILPGGERYLILERIHPRGNPSLADMLLSLLEQKSLGIYQGDFKPANMVFDGNICYLVDYDQAQIDQSFIQMGNLEFIDWIANDFFERRNEDFFSQEDREFDRDEFLECFMHDSFNLSLTSVLKNQLTTRTESGIYHEFFFPQVHTQGARNLDSRRELLDEIVFNPGETVLDVGCNLGLLSHYLHDRGCNVTGVDMDANVVIAAKMISNILGKSINYERLDIGKTDLNRHFETICLFSVFHHIQDIKFAAININSYSRRVIMESKLWETGSVPIRGRWKRSNVWRFESLEDLIDYVEIMLPDFTLERVWGQVDRDRYLFTFLRR